MKIDLYPSLFKKFNPERVKDHNIRPDTMNLIEEKIENILEFTGLRKEFLIRTLIA